jgi:hypothetical protein
MSEATVLSPASAQGRGDETRPQRTFGWIMEEELEQVEIHDTGRGNSGKLITDHEHTPGEEGPRNNKFKAFLPSSDEDSKVF